MKLSKTAWLILGTGILVIALVSLYLVYSRQGHEREQLNDSLLVARATLPKVVSEKEDRERQLTQLENQLTQLESELTQATSLLAESKMSFPGSVESIEYDERLFRIADYYDLEITKLTSSEPGNKAVEGITYSVTSFEIDARGEVADILGFVNAIATDEDFTTATVELVDMKVPGPLTEKEKGELTEEEIEQAEKPSATIKLVIYGYKGE